MSTSDNAARSRKQTRIAYMIATAFCLLFGTVYELFSHGVYAPAMYLLFLYPLGGVLPFFFLKCYPTPAVRWLWHCGIATLTCGSCVTGVIEIYGTECALLPLYYGVGAGLCLLGAVEHLIGILLKKV